MENGKTVEMDRNVNTMKGEERFKQHCTKKNYNNKKQQLFVVVPNVGDKCKAQKPNAKRGRDSLV